MRSCLCPTSELRRLVAAGLWQTGYYADWMCDRERDGGRFSSRDLLLALGWLLATGSVEKLLTQRVLQLDKTLLTPTHVCTTNIPAYYASKPISVCICLVRNFGIFMKCFYMCNLCVFQVSLQFTSGFQLDSVSLRKLQWLTGCLRHQGRTLLSMQEERARLLHAVRKFPSIRTSCLQSFQHIKKMLIF